MHEPDAWPKADSYDDKAYGTQDPASIIAQLDKTYNDSLSQPDVQPGLEDSVAGKPRRGAIYQLQATPQVNIVRTPFWALCMTYYEYPLSRRRTYLLASRRPMREVYWYT